ncbi:Cof-type HAD-IIB family hydrolase [Lactiplantibacillus fabifermentans]|uniref:Hydrolase, had superfamily, cof family n=2 Tax=Lactiplantibacillus fabifermentans TaxID=483011 RepID=A0A0R2NQ50_9LACO|nr:Cof-type HAD-IIB family hydrolase [Lactiplantibacillus fabifermentans]ETY75149.1 HAD family hydrolase [Lactiplantibacillus fabifermentans T30PCM01]KRO27815.1 hydrolase, had superfamily, cof family [Lactiplantibacillus fabifermentans DSM 21115]
MISIIASDMDGTLLNNEMTVSDFNAQAIRKAQQQGVHFIVSTGRRYSEAQPLLAAQGITAPLITLNGAEVYDASGKMLDMVPITNTVARAIFHTLNAKGYYFEVVGNDGIYSNNKAKRIEEIAHLLTNLNPDTSFKIAVSLASARLELMDINYVDNYDELLADPKKHVMKIITFSQDGPAKLQPLADELLAKHSSLKITSSSRSNIEINNINAQKGIAVERYANMLNTPMTDVMAIGDNNNDVSMLELAGTSYAMGNATTEVKQLASHITDTNVNDGVGKAILEVLAQQ